MMITRTIFFLCCYTVISMAAVFGLGIKTQPLRTPHGTYVSHGLLNTADANPNVTFRISGVDVVLIAITAPTIIIPAYLIGFDIMEPVKLNKERKK